MPKHTVRNSTPTDEALRRPLSEQASDAFEYCISRYSVGLAFGMRSANVDMATGIAVNWHGQRILVTAKHVFREAQESEGVTLVFPRDRAIHRGDMPERLPPVDLSCIKYIPQVSVVRCKSENLDLAYFKMAEDAYRGSDLDFYALPSIAKSPPVGAPCVLSGFPSDLSGPISRDEAVVRLANRWSKICSLGTEERFLKSFDPEYHFLMRFHKADRGERAEGFSGAGVWFPLSQSSDSAVWHPVPGLAGIQSQWFPKNGLTLSIRAEFLVRFLEESLT